LVLIAGFATQAQVKIGTNPTTLGASSLLELESTSKALIVPRVANTAAIPSPTNGMVIYDISTQCMRGYANNAWTDCGFAPVSPCSSPALTAVAGTGTITPGSTATFTTTASNYTSVSWTVTNSASAVIYSGTGLTTGSLSFPTAGTYTVSFTATNAPATGCSPASVSVTATETVAACAITTPTASVTQPTCPNNLGAITIAAQTGAEYSVNNGGSYQASNVFTSLAPGNYYLKVRIAGNTSCASASVTQVLNNANCCTATAAVITSITHLNCSGGLGAITIAPQTGVQYSIDNGGNYQASNIFNNLGAGYYYAKVRMISNPSCSPAYTLVEVASPECVPNCTGTVPTGVTATVRDTGLGSIPGTIVFSVAGTGVTSANTTYTANPSSSATPASGTGNSVRMSFTDIGTYTTTFTACNGTLPSCTPVCAAPVSASVTYIVNDDRYEATCPWSSWTFTGCGARNNTDFCTLDVDYGDSCSGGSASKTFTTVAGKTYRFVFIDDQGGTRSSSMNYRVASTSGTTLLTGNYNASNTFIGSFTASTTSTRITFTHSGNTTGTDSHISKVQVYSLD